MSRCPTGTVYRVSQVSQATFLAENQGFAGIPPLSQVGHPWDSWDNWDRRDTRDKCDAWDTSEDHERREAEQ
jgi:hypothetical protein